MEVAAAKTLGAGLAVIALFGVGIGIGNIFSSLVASRGPQPGGPRRASSRSASWASR